MIYVEIAVAATVKRIFLCRSSRAMHPHHNTCTQWTPHRAASVHLDVIDRHYGASADRRNGASLKRKKRAKLGLNLGWILPVFEELILWLPAPVSVSDKNRHRASGNKRYDAVDPGLRRRANGWPERPDPTL